MSRFKFMNVDSGEIHSITAKTYLSATGYVRYKSKSDNLKFDLLSIKTIN